MAVSRVSRTDVGSRLGKFARNGAGAVRVPATIARTGVQNYPEQGLVEYRPAEEVFAADSLASLGSVPVTLRHPPRGVSPANSREHQVGHVSDAAPEARVRIDGSSDEWVRALLVVSDGEVQDALEGGTAGSISCGYSCDLDMTPGVAPDGTKYDAIQRNIRFNHVAILTADQKPRAGGEAKVRLDSQGNPIMKMIVIDGVELEYGSDKHFAHVADAHQKALDASKAQLDAATARADGLQAKLDAEKTRADAAVAGIDVAVEKRFALLQRAAKFLPGVYDTAGKSDSQIRVDALSAAKVDVAGKSEAYIEARFDGLTDANAPAQYHSNVDGVPAKKASVQDSDDAFRAALDKKDSK